MGYQASHVSKFDMQVLGCACMHVNVCYGLYKDGVVPFPILQIQSRYRVRRTDCLNHPATRSIAQYIIGGSTRGKQPEWQWLYLHTRYLITFSERIKCNALHFIMHPRRGQFTYVHLHLVSLVVAYHDLNSLHTNCGMCLRHEVDVRKSGNELL